MFHHYPYTGGSAYVLWKRLNKGKSAGLRRIQFLRYSIGLSCDPEYILESTYALGCMDLLLELASMYPMINFQNLAIRVVYKNGHLNIAKWLHHQHYHIDREIIIACSFGHMRLAKWMYKIGHDPKDCNNTAARWACANGYLCIVKWVRTLCVHPRTRPLVEFGYIV